MCPSAAATLSLPGPGHGNQATAARHVSLCQHSGSRSHSVLQTRPHHEVAGRAFSPRPRGDPRPQKSVFVGRWGVGGTGQGRPCHHLAVDALCVTSTAAEGTEQVWGLPRATNLRSLHPRGPQCFTATRGHSFFKRLLFGTTFFFFFPLS